MNRKGFLVLDFGDTDQHREGCLSWQFSLGFVRIRWRWNGDGETWHVGSRS
jgi:hypothetical protein